MLHPDVFTLQPDQFLRVKQSLVARTSWCSIMGIWVLRRYLTRSASKSFIEPTNTYRLSTTKAEMTATTTTSHVITPIADWSASPSCGELINIPPLDPNTTPSTRHSLFLHPLFILLIFLPLSNHLFQIPFPPPQFHFLAFE